MYQLLLIIYVFAAVFIIALVLVQQGKGASVGASFGSGASQTVFGSRGSGSFLFRLTIGLITVFFVTCLILNYLTMRAYKTPKAINLPAAVLKQPIKNTSAPATTSAPAEIPVRN